ncbi:helix-turn-helix transcriptional regulator [Gammaproteobacteria bacterium AB-CW1]|uniref:Helix-turn-helix transcriptional regulator n=1 Tax=Natronospira elongata TaxID=3110268 RepID=A0AAP6MNH7_9GAMM|nr:helix-turn-helix transcriptional regulator [Gammaproteobacteria bacterium AB-CW1]
MAGARTHAYSHYTRQAIRLLGVLVRTGRLEKRMTAQELSERAGISRDMLYRIEKGDPRVQLGAAFEVAAIVGVPLFEAEPGPLDARLRAATDRLALLPSAVRKSPGKVKDDF